MPVPVTRHPIDQIHQAVFQPPIVSLWMMWTTKGIRLLNAGTP